MQKEIYSVQNWLPFEKILENGIIKINSDLFIKVIKVDPINFNLKSELEKEAILNSYKILLKTCNFDIQILIQSNKENLLSHISKIKFQKENEKEKIKKISENYIQYIKKINKNKKSSNKTFYILLKNKKNIENKKTEEIIIEELNENFYKIKECLSRCGNIVKDLSNREETREMIYSFINRRDYVNKV